MSLTQHLTDGGIPRDWTAENLRWLAEKHWYLGQDKNTAKHGVARASWHRRWAALLTDLLETPHVHHHRVQRRL